MADNKFSDNIKEALAGISAMADGNTMIGETITTPNGTTIIPVSKISVGYASGNLDYSTKSGNATRGTDPNNFSGVGGTGFSIVPVAFLVVLPSGNVELLNINSPTGDGSISSLIGLIERSPELVNGFREAFSKKD